MKYMTILQNARSKAERIFRSGFAFAFLVFVFLILVSFCLRKWNLMNETALKAQLGIHRAIQSDMAKCAQLGRRMQYAGANIQDELLPELKVYLYSLSNLTNAFYESFPEAEAPVQIQFLSKVSGAAQRLERDYCAGYPAESSEKALFRFLDEFSVLLDRWENAEG